MYGNPGTAVIRRGAAMIPIKDILPTRTTPVVARGILIISLALHAVEAFSGRPGRPSLLQLAANTTAFWLFADTLEDRLGRWRFLGLYLLAHAAAAFVGTRLGEPGRWVIGLASGAVAGVLGAYFALYPRSRVLVLVPLPLRLFEVPAPYFLGLFVVLHTPLGWAALAEAGTGWVAGATLGLLLRRPVVW
jgi:membrane associated rhomboid family serine protease